MNKFVVLGDSLLSDEPLGIQRFAYELLKEIDCLPRDYEIEVLIPEGMPCRLKLNTIPVVRYGAYASGFLWRQFKFTEYVKKEKAIPVDLTLGLTVLNCGVVCVFDCIYENFPNDFVGWKAKIKRLSYLLRVKYVLKHARKVITISHHSQEDILKHYSIPKSKIEIIFCGWQHFLRIQPDDLILEKLHLRSGTYIFSLGSSLPHKNFEWVIRAAKNNPEILFVVTGTNRLSSYQDHLGTNGIENVLFTGFLQDNEVKALMMHCAAFVHPSFYEGFGIPPLEAISCGAKVFVSNKSCLPEIFGDSVIYFDPNSDPIRIDDMLQQIPSPSDDILKKYSWAESAKKMNSLLTELASDESLEIQ